jgi:hypothetical protein
MLGYVRVSSHEQADHGYGLPVQEQRIVDFRGQQSLELVMI